MQKQRLKENIIPVGALSVRNTQEKAPIAPMQNSNVITLISNKRGITLIALIITIIVMLILVGVTVSVALNGGLFTTAKDAAKRTEAERDKEIALSEGKIEVDGVWYETMDDYLNNKPMIILPEGWSKIKKPAEWDNDKITAVTDGTNTLPLPEGFCISEVKEEQTVEGGLVITDGTNEFVWIPVTENYTEDNLGPLTDEYNRSNAAYDSQDTLNFLYGEGAFNYAKDFTYQYDTDDKTKIETSINKYKGFYVGRYETTIDEEGNIGSKANTEVLTAGHTIKEGTNPNNNQAYYYRWYGLYKVQKDMYAGNETVFSSMITSKEWDKIMDFTGYGSAIRGQDTYTTTPDLSGAAYKNTNPAQYDVSKNIYDLAGNVHEWTLTPDSSKFRVNRARCLRRQQLFSVSQYQPLSELLLGKRSVVG